ncbi:hypothetical protein PHMEG_00014416 [Phytophthora megakarya]|uniref:Uncharacterized protein n=1 Tax=Phytophthora megakarya TaxID=4795 RepID=A0A225W3U6_9STRA|nr:hypothetical protein PHMEG_00014416 [Phytophthora megakarya]
MGATVCRKDFVEDVYANYVSDEHPSGLALYVDTLKFQEEWDTELVPLPKNTMSVLQP